MPDSRLIHPLLLATFAAATISCGGAASKSIASYDTAASANPQRAYATAGPVSGGAAEANRASAGGESYDRLVENAVTEVAAAPMSTFSIDVDTASYANVRRFINGGHLPPKNAVRIEELINYFSYDYPEPEREVPFAVVTEVGTAPWNPAHKLVHIGLQGKRIDKTEIPPRNLVFLLDVSGSMNYGAKLPLLKSALSMLVEQLTAQDRVSIVVYAGAAGAVLTPTSGANKNAILSAMHRLRAGGSTNGGQGIQLAYALAEKNFDKDAINRVILATDGDFNVGVSDRKSLTRLIENKRKTGIYLTVLGFGTGNLKDSRMEALADKGNGNYAYIDSLAEARKVLVNEAGGTLVTIAKDVKIQVEFNPEQVQSYRLVGYENRILRDADFDNDNVDAGEIGAGHTVTALYELTPASDAPANAELMTVKLRYKQPDAKESQLLSVPVANAPSADAGSENFRFSAAVAGYGMLLRSSEYTSDFTFEDVATLAKSAIGDDANGYRGEFLRLVNKAAALGGKQSAAHASVAR